MYGLLLCSCSVPDLIEPRRTRTRIVRRMARISVAKEILHQAKVGTLVGEGIAACMPKHVRVDTAETCAATNLKQ